MNRHPIWNALIRFGKNPRIVAFVVFDFIWLSAVLGRNDWFWVTALLIALMFAATPRPLWLQRKSFLIIFAAGIMVEWATVLGGVITFTDTSGVPAWLYLLWIGFTGMALVVFDWLHRRLVLALLAGAIFGPITYLAGARFGAAELHFELPITIAIYATAWALLMVLIAFQVNPKILAQRNHLESKEPSSNS
ncbi:DUF2878 domain-containing protein [Aliidiomarina sanyensis]|uniref:DUF2878 domain-containing protein n=1 Tax=Aliidiomarina sanyensis TaxID=1249555 RepID=A0A432WS48_9GAMM|nr:DUF2878 domain-containing protein [Aliidiomarina sanyensis]RUO36591.1 hypothetical protein CWE11_01910 [Aliidiomarina sanyensis]